MAELTPRMAWPFPEEDDDPWFDTFVDLMRAQDQSGFAAREDRNIVVSGGGTVSWNAPTFQWTLPFQVWSPSTGFYTQFLATSLMVQDGEVVRAEIVRAPGLNTSVAIEVASIAQNTDNSFILARRVGDTLWWYNGFPIPDGSSDVLEDLFGGDDDGFSYKVIVAGKSVTIKANRQMVVSGGITIDGELILDGELALIPSS